MIPDILLSLEEGGGSPEGGKAVAERKVEGEKEEEMGEHFYRHQTLLMTHLILQIHCYLLHI